MRMQGVAARSGAGTAAGAEQEAQDNDAPARA
eukprot:CAMPEP_0179897392 /NCGR_PEP_ID=MMETSP0982-20121206/36986_1 /TAXON_ID=483367 /ORGANISM="non described non described, Strain CCMP 2436" /LENGTH=31 /DNA_ID= /DNA_START= /DNA_END= /DNA_ORIENTATION=